MNTPTGSINEAWASYADQVLPNDAPDVQVKETRRAFYAGAALMFSNLTNPKIEPSEKVVKMWVQELNAFKDKVDKGLA